MSSPVGHGEQRTGIAAWVRRHHGWIPVVLGVGAIVLWFAWRPAYRFVGYEDGVVEWLTFFVYCAAAAAAAKVALLLYRSRLRWEAGLYALLALGFAFVAGEEISWGQRIFDFYGPEELVALNNQGEANVHNILGRYFLHAAYIGVGLAGAYFARKIVPKVPLLRERAWLWAPPRELAPWFAAVVVYYVWVDYLDPVVELVLGPEFLIFQVNRLQEFPELALAGGFLLFILQVGRRVRGESASDTGRSRESQAM